MEEDSDLFMNARRPGNRLSGFFDPLLSPESLHCIFVQKGELFYEYSNRQSEFRAVSVRRAGSFIAGKASGGSCGASCFEERVLHQISGRGGDADRCCGSAAVY
jgi:hypothetical protein